jgi:hypothetical protein
VTVRVSAEVLSELNTVAVPGMQHLGQRGGCATRCQADLACLPTSGLVRRGEISAVTVDAVCR